jgi:hypothetical protein
MRPKSFSVKRKSQLLGGKQQPDAPRFSGNSTLSLTTPIEFCSHAGKMV